MDGIETPTELREARARAFLNSSSRIFQLPGILSMLIVPKESSESWGFGGRLGSGEPTPAYGAGCSMVMSDDAQIAHEIVRS